MERDFELEQVLCNALSLQEDYPVTHLPLSDQDKSPTTTGKDHELLPGMEMQIPLKDPNMLQETLLELYSMLGIPYEDQNRRPMNTSKKQEPSMPSTSNQEEPTLTREHANRLKGSLTEEELESSKKTRDEEEQKLPTTSSQKSRKRTLYDKQQTYFLQKQFDFNPYPDYLSRCYFAQITRIPEPRIQVWFQNRRARYLTKASKSQTTEPTKIVGRKSFFAYGASSQRGVFTNKINRNQNSEQQEC